MSPRTATPKPSRAARHSKELPKEQPKEHSSASSRRKAKTGKGKVAKTRARTAKKSEAQSTPRRGKKKVAKTPRAAGSEATPKKRRGKKKTAKASRAARPSRARDSKAKPKGQAPTRRAKASSRARPRGILVTGATGFLGKHIVEHLAARRDAVPSARRPVLRALVRHPSLHLERWGVDCVVGDVCDEAACAEALRGVGQVYHLAGFVSRRRDDGPDLYRVHVDGTRTLLRVAAEVGVERVVVVSTSGTIAVSRDPDEVSDESSPYRQTTVAHWPYYLSKIYQEETALEARRSLGIEVVLVNPSLLLGPGDERGSSTTDVERVVRGRLPVIPRGGGVAFVDARDAADGCILAMEKGTDGERYLLSAANMTLQTFLGRVARLAQVPTPRAVVAPRTLKVAGRLLDAVYSRFDATPPVDAASVEMAEHTWYVDATKARESLGWAPRDPQETLADTVRDIESRH